MHLPLAEDVREHVFGEVTGVLFGMFKSEIKDVTTVNSFSFSTALLFYSLYLACQMACQVVYID